MKKRMLLLAIAAIGVFVAKSQLLTWSPAFPKENESITITVDATKGNQGLLGFTGDVYVHVGAITNLSTGPSNWLHAPFTWGSTTAAAKATPAGPNKWSYTIANPRTFFTLDAGEELKYIAILFRKGGCSDACSAQRNADGSDMYVPIYTNALAVRLDQPVTEPKYIRVPEPQNWTVGSSFAIKALANKSSAMKIYHNGTQLASATAVQSLEVNSIVAAVGNQQIVAESNDGTTTKYDTLNILVVGTPVAPLPAGVSDGANYESGDTSVILVLRAPGKNKAIVIGDFNNWTLNANYAMNKTPDGKFFWLRVRGLTPGAEYAYQYVVDDNIKIADAYAKKILDPTYDPSISPAIYPGLKPYPAGQSGIVSVLQTAKPGYTWTVNNFTRPDKRSLVIYEMLPRDFVAAHDWKTIRDSLNYLKNLGINAIEVMPFNEFENNSSWGYNPSFFFALDKYYGTENAFKAFVDSCHKKGIAVIMDIVLNHTMGQSPLVQLYWDAQNNRPAANNPWYNAVQPHAFGFGNDFNHESTNTKDLFNRVLQYWINEYKIDGYRFDFSKGLTQKASTNDGNFSAYDASRIAIINSYAAAIRAVDANSYIILEHFADNTEEKELANNGMLIWANLNHSYSQAAMGQTADWDFSWGIHTSRTYTNPHLVTYMESHDEERVTYRNINFGNSAGGYNVRDSATAFKRMQLAAAFLLTIPGPKMVWQFGELGYDYPINYCPNGTISNDCRTSEKPIRWDYLNDSRRKNIHTTYSKLINLRHHDWYKQAFISGSIDKNLGGAVKWIHVNSGDSSRLFVVGNFGVTAEAGTVTFPASGTWFDLLENTTITGTGNPQLMSLAPGEFHVFVNRNVNNLSTTPVTNVPWNGTTLEASLYPNPVAASTYTLELNLPQSGNVTVELYNALGQYVSTVYNGFQVRGTRQVPLVNRTAAKGNYFARIITKSATKTVQVTFQ